LPCVGGLPVGGEPLPWGGGLPEAVFPAKIATTSAS
jgi:hypothetical protein